MSATKFNTTLTWQRSTPDFSYETYQRAHTIRFEGGTEIKASAAPDFKGDASMVNPEEGLLAALSSCHMLTFLAIAAKSRYVVDSYVDQATAVLGKNEAGRLCVSEATLNPCVKFSGGKIPNQEELARLHEKAHIACFIANSVHTRVTITPQ
jgi:organic hydroperoxide reductase OsmC/OhrA